MAYSSLSEEFFSATATVIRIVDKVGLRYVTVFPTVPSPPARRRRQARTVEGTSAEVSAMLPLCSSSQKFYPAASSDRKSGNTEGSGCAVSHFVTSTGVTASNAPLQSAITGQFHPRSVRLWKMTAPAGSCRSFGDSIASTVSREHRVASLVQ